MQNLGFGGNGILGDLTKKASGKKLIPNEMDVYLDNVKEQMEGTELSNEEDWHNKEIGGKKAIEAAIKEKESDLVGNMASQGTTPRQLTDLIGSLCDLTSGSGDKGTPIVFIQGYFDNYTTE